MNDMWYITLLSLLSVSFIAVLDFIDKILHLDD